MKTVSFVGTCLLRSTEVLVCKRINHPFNIKKITATFPIGCVNELKLRFYLAIDDQTPTTGEPTGVSMLKDYGQVDYIVGDGVQKVMEHEVEQKESGSFIKVYAENSDYFDHEIDVQIELEPKERS